MSTQLKIQKEKTQIGQSSSVQIFIVILIDSKKALEENSLVGNVYMMDNSYGSKGQGTPDLQTIIKPGQILNILIYSMDNDKGTNGKYPPLSIINNIVFLTPDRKEVSQQKIVDYFHRYGGADNIRSQHTPIYYYWSGMIRGDLPIGVYNYRIIIDISVEDSFKKVYLNLDSPSLKVIPVHPVPSDLD